MSNDFQWPISKTPNVLSASRLSPPPPPGCCVAHSRPQRARTLARKGNGVRGSSVQVFLGTSQRYVVYIIYTITHLRKIDRFFVFTPKKVGMRFSRYIYKCTIMSLSFGYIKEQISETWRMPYDWNHDRSRGQPRVAWTDPRWAMGLVDYNNWVIISYTELSIVRDKPVAIHLTNPRHLSRYLCQRISRNLYSHCIPLAVQESVVATKPRLVWVFLHLLAQSTPPGRL
jgi:hypothetical protein